MAAPLPLHYAHLVLAAVWLGFLVGALAMSYRGSGALIEYHRLYGRIALAALALVGLLGLAMATYLGGPSDWFRFGTFTGRVGEKMISFLIIAALGGYMHHSLARKMEAREGSEETLLKRYRVVATIALIVTLGTMLLGSMITKGA